MTEEIASGLALYVIDAVQSVADPARSAQVQGRYRAYRAAQGKNAADDSVRALLRTFEQAGGGDQWAGKVGNFRRRYNPTDAPVAAAAIERAAGLLYTHRINDAADLASAMTSQELNAELERGLTEIAGSPSAWARLSGLAGRRQLTPA
jgi:hypothetical protein